MPLTTDLRPGKNGKENGDPTFPTREKISYNGNISKYAPSNMNGDLFFRVFERDEHGNTLSQNQCLINQDIHSVEHKNKDLTFQLKTRRNYPFTYEEKYNLLLPQIKAAYPTPKRFVTHQG